MNKRRKILVKSRSKPDSFSEDTDSFNLSDDNSITRFIFLLFPCHYDNFRNSFE